MSEDMKDPLLTHAISAINAMQRYEQNLEEKTQEIAHLKQQKLILEDNIQLLYEKYEGVNQHKANLKTKREKLKQTISQIENFKSQIQEKFDSMLNNIKKDKDLFEN